MTDSATALTVDEEKAVAKKAGPCQPNWGTPRSSRYTGRCHAAQMSPSTTLDDSAPLCRSSLGSAYPRHPNSSLSEP